MITSISSLFFVIGASAVSISSALMTVPHPTNTRMIPHHRTFTTTSSFSMTSNNSNNEETTPEVQAQSSSSRRKFFTNSAKFTSAAFTTIALTTTTTPNPSHATLMDTNTEGATTFKPGQKLSIPESKKRFSQARTEIQYLLDNYSTISSEGGDSVRRYLGTVGVNSNMYGITKILKDLRDESEDVVEYQETLDEFNAYLFQAEGAAYQSLFVEHSSAKGTPESFLATAKKDVVMMQKFMDRLAGQLDM